MPSSNTSILGSPTSSSHPFERLCVSLYSDHSLIPLSDSQSYEQRLLAGIKLIKQGASSIRATAKQLGVSHETLRRRCQGASSRKSFHAQLMALTPDEELLVENMIFSFITCGNMLTSTFLCNLANDFRKNKATEAKLKPPKELGISWTAGFRRRHPKVSQIMAKSMSRDLPGDQSASSSSSSTSTSKPSFEDGLKQQYNETSESSYSQWIDQVFATTSKHDIQSHNFYNLMELGFSVERKLRVDATVTSNNIIFPSSSSSSLSSSTSTSISSTAPFKKNISIHSKKRKKSGAYVSHKKDQKIKKESVSSSSTSSSNNRKDTKKKELKETELRDHREIKEKMFDNLLDLNSSITCISRTDFMKNAKSSTVFASSLECVCADGSFLAPMYTCHSAQQEFIIGNSSDSGWLFKGEYSKCLESSDGWSNSDAMYNWLVNVFEPSTKNHLTTPIKTELSTTENSSDTPAKPQFRVIFMDGNARLFSSKVLKFAIDHNILFALFPSQSSQQQHQHQSFQQNLQQVQNRQLLLNQHYQQSSQYPSQQIQQQLRNFQCSSPQVSIAFAPIEIVLASLNSCVQKFSSLSPSLSPSSLKTFCFKNENGETRCDNDNDDDGANEDNDDNGLDNGDDVWANKIWERFTDILNLSRKEAFVSSELVLAWKICGIIPFDPMTDIQTDENVHNSHTDNVVDANTDVNVDVVDVQLKKKTPNRSTVIKSENGRNKSGQKSKLGKHKQLRHHCQPQLSSVDNNRVCKKSQEKTTSLPEYILTSSSNQNNHFYQSHIQQQQHQSQNFHHYDNQHDQHVQNSQHSQLPSLFETPFSKSPNLTFSNSDDSSECLSPTLFSHSLNESVNTSPDTDAEGGVGLGSLGGVGTGLSGINGVNGVDVGLSGIGVASKGAMVPTFNDLPELSVLDTFSLGLESHTSSVNHHHYSHNQHNNHQHHYPVSSINCLGSVTTSSAASANAAIAAASSLDTAESIGLDVKGLDHDGMMLHSCLDTSTSATAAGVATNNAAIQNSVSLALTAQHLSSTNFGFSEINNLNNTSNMCGNMGINMTSINGMTGISNIGNLNNTAATTAPTSTSQAQFIEPCLVTESLLRGGNGATSEIGSTMIEKQQHHRQQSNNVPVPTQGQSTKSLFGLHNFNQSHVDSHFDHSYHDQQHPFSLIDKTSFATDFSLPSHRNDQALHSSSSTSTSPSLANSSTPTLVSDRISTPTPVMTTSSSPATSTPTNSIFTPTSSSITPSTTTATITPTTTTSVDPRSLIKDIRSQISQHFNTRPALFYANGARADNSDAQKVIGIVDEVYEQLAIEH